MFLRSSNTGTEFIYSRRLVSYRDAPRGVLWVVLWLALLCTIYSSVQFTLQRECFRFVQGVCMSMFPTGVTSKLC